MNNEKVSNDEASDHGDIRILDDDQGEVNIDRGAGVILADRFGRNSTLFIHGPN